MVNTNAFHGGKGKCVYDMTMIAVILLASLAVGSCSESSNGDTGCGSDCRLETIGPGGGNLVSVSWIDQHQPIAADRMPIKIQRDKMARFRRPIAAGTILGFPGLRTTTTKDNNRATSEAGYIQTPHVFINVTVRATPS